MSNNEVLVDIRERLVRVETKIDNMSNTKETADKALTSAQSAHKRLDLHEKILYWAGTTIIGAMILGIIAYFIRE